MRPAVPVVLSEQAIAWMIVHLANSAFYFIS